MDIFKALLVKSLSELLTITACLSQQKTQAKDIQEEDIRMSINLPYIEDTSEELQHILRSHRIRSTFTLCKLLCKFNDWVATEDKNNIVYELLR